jgi:uncharacterized protein YjbI with pentapeptide repeats
MNMLARGRSKVPSRIDLSGAFIRRTDASGASLVGANLSHADRTNAIFRGADFKDAILEATILRGADLAGALDLTRQHIQRAILGGRAVPPEGLR